MNLSLFFQKGTSIELGEMEFAGATGHPRLCRRGKLPFANDQSGNFQWSSAVKAFALLVVGARLGIADNKRKSYVLSGEANSAAASLDFAISKPTQWISDLFGRDSTGRSQALRVFRRENTERKRPGPVRISLSANVLGARELRIFLESKELLDKKDLTSLFVLLEREISCQFSKSNRKAGSFQQFEHSPAARDAKHWSQSTWFRNVLQREIVDALSESSLMEQLGVERSLAEMRVLLGDTLAKKMERCATELQARVEPAARRYRIGSPAGMRKRIKGEISVCCAPFAFGALSIVTLVASAWKFPLTLDWNFPSTSAILEQLDRPGVPQVLILSWGAALKLILKNRRAPFIAAALLPKTRFDLLLPKEANNAVSRVFVARESHGYPRRYFEKIRESDRALLKRSKLVGASLVEAVDRLRSGDGAAVLGFPLGQILSKCISSELHKNSDKLPRVSDNVLFISSKLPRACAQALLEAFRGAWFTLLEDPASRALVSDSIIASRQYVDFLQRVGGLYFLTPEENTF